MTEVPCPCACKGTHCMRIEHHGQVYRCTAALSDVLGLTRGAIWQSLARNGTTAYLGTNRRGRGNNKKPVQVGPHKWPTIGAMAQDLGLDRSHLGKLLKHDKDRVLAYVMKVKG